MVGVNRRSLYITLKNHKISKAKLEMAVLQRVCQNLFKKMHAWNLLGKDGKKETEKYENGICIYLYSLEINANTLHTCTFAQL